jgi:CHAD domain-containing protein
MPKWMKSASPDDCVAEVAARCLTLRLKRVRRFLPLAATKAEEDVEHVHQLRVWTRRAGAAMQLFEQFLPRQRGKRLAEQLKRIRKTAGDARDLDVLLARLSGSASQAEELAPLVADVQRRRAAAQPPIAELHEELSAGKRLRRRSRKFVARVRWRGEGSGEEPRYGPWSDLQLRDVLEPFFEAAAVNSADLDALHKFRIAGKKLRYTMELLAGAYPRSFRKELYGEIVALQEKLGAINDHRVARARYFAWADEEGIDPAYADLLRRMAQSEERCLEETRCEFSAWWSDQRTSELRQRFDAMLSTRDE